MIVVDAGHGGDDPGAVAGGVREKHLALVYALSLGGELCRLNLPVLYTRTADVMPGGGTANAGLSYRARIANDAAAVAFISVHFNASTNVDAAGIWLIHAVGAAGGRSLALAIRKELGGEVYPDKSGWTGGRRLAVLRQTKCPAVLIEYGFVTNAAERARLQQAEHMRALVAQTARGIVAWMT